MNYSELFAQVRSEFTKADVSGIKEHLAYQFNITGDAEGIFYIEVKDGELFIEPYEYFDRDVMFTLNADTLLKIASGKLDPIAAFTIQKLKVEGNFDKALKLQDFIKKAEKTPVKTEKTPAVKKEKK